MVRVSRYRTRKTFSKVGRTLSWNNPEMLGPPAAISANGPYEAVSSISDWIGRPIVPSMLYSVQRKGFLYLNGYAANKNYSRKFEDSPFLWKVDGSSTLWTPLSAPPGWQLDLIAGTNPSRPVLTVPEMLQNLIELPKLLYDTIKFFANPKKAFNAKGVANHYLLAKFGWMPLIEDLNKLINLQSYVLKRTKELNQLHSGRGLRRRLQFKSDTSEASSSYTLALPGTAITGSAMISSFIKRRSWGTLRWFPTSPPPYHPLDSKNHAFARRVVLGLTPEGMALGLWKVIPWTWLLGWFTNVGKLALSSSNTVPARYEGACFMSEVTVVRSGGAFVFTDASAKGNLRITGQQTYSVKSRSPGTGSILPGFSMPFLDIGRLSVLGALAVQRMR